MSAILERTQTLRGGEFLVKDSEAFETFIPEDLTEEQLMVKAMARDFLEQEIGPVRADIEKQKEGAAPALLKKMGDLGLLGAHMPTEYGGMEMDTNTNTVISDVLGPSGSFSVTFAAHMGIGMLPILYFGTEAQKAKYLPDLIKGDKKAAYCLTEPGSGSDALAAKTRADLSEDGLFYALNGQKMWISNAGFADIFIVFAKIGGKDFTGFIVERETAGLTFGAEEDKLGIKGSSTRQVFFENCRVPAENVLGQIGKGHLIAFNALNIGRFKLGAMCIGGAKAVTTMAIGYANERQQFGQSIGNFGAIQHKLAEMAVRTFAGDSAMYRVSDWMEQKKNAELEAGKTFAEANLLAAEEYALECSILKIYGSEVTDFCVDENVQIHGGMGFSEELGAARAYRDSRINRIYEGTNEINRLLMIDLLFKRALKGAIDIVSPAWAVQKELSSMPSMERPGGRFGEEKQAVSDFKKIILMVAGGAAKMQMDGKLNLKDEQEIVMNVSDMMIDLYNCESVLLRVEKLSERSTEVDFDLYENILRLQIHDSTARISKWATDALASFAEGDLLKTFLMGVKRFSKYPVQNVKTLRREIAAELLKRGGYCF